MGIVYKTLLLPGKPQKCCDHSQYSRYNWRGAIAENRNPVHTFRILASRSKHWHTHHHGTGCNPPVRLHYLQRELVIHCRALRMHNHHHHCIASPLNPPYALHRQSSGNIDLGAALGTVMVWLPRKKTLFNIPHMF
jgi:hypothetical protein